MEKSIPSLIDEMQGGNPQNEAYFRLWNMYNEVEKQHDKRFIDKTFDKNDLLKDLKQLEQRPLNCNPDAPDYMTLFHLVKTNILLRAGQAAGGEFLDPTEMFREALTILERYFNPEGSEWLDYMLQLNLGKLFREMGHYNNRSDFLRASDEFGELLRKLEKRNENNQQFENWEAYIWLEAALNLARIDLQLYRIRDAKIRLWDIFRLIAPLAGDIVSHFNLEKILGIDLNWESTCSITLEYFGEQPNLYTYYCVQLLVQLSIAYQKSCDYKTAQLICMVTLEIDQQNVDALNNFAVCLRKQGIKTKLSDNEEELEQYIELGFNGGADYFQKQYIEIFEQHAGYTKGSSKSSYNGENRFAKLRYFQARIANKGENDKDKSREPTIETIEKNINELLKENPRDYQVRLLKALFLQRDGRQDEAFQIFQELYKDSPQIRTGTIGLKAYYNIGCYYVSTQNFYKAMKVFSRICDETRDQGRAEDANMEEISKNRSHLRDLPRGDLLASIDKGWCLLNIGDYQKATECYEEILKRYEHTNDRLRIHNEMRIRNNLAECYLHQISKKIGNNNADGNAVNNLFEKAKEQLGIVEDKEPNNSTMYRHWGSYYLLKARREQNNIEHYNTALSFFDKVETGRADDIYTYSAWVTAAVGLYERRGSLNDEKEKQKTIKRLEKRLRFGSGVYSMKACAKLAWFIEDLGKGQFDENSLITLYRSMARITLGENEEGYGLFRNLRNNDIFRRLDASRRGKLLTILFQVYEHVLQIKTICRYSPESSKGDFVIPVHYTKLPQFKALLPEDPESKGRLRLWNTVYMNDSFEGECFVDMLRRVKINRLRSPNSDSPEDKAEKAIERYFPYLHGQHSQEDPLIPSNENIYVTSFTKRDDAIHMWISYADNARGCAIKFAEDFFGLRISEDTLTNVASYSDADYPMYRIQYLDFKKWSGDGATYSKEEKDINRIIAELNEIWGLLEKLESVLDSGKPTGSEQNKGDYDPSMDSVCVPTPYKTQEDQLICNFVAGCLNEVRFLIKDVEYSTEEEIRLVHYSTDSKLESDGVIIPRLYVEVDRDIQIQDVKLGSKIDEQTANSIVSWLMRTGKVRRITRSERHYK